MKTEFFNLSLLEKLVRDALFEVRDYEIGSIESWQTLQQIGMKKEDIIPVVEKIKEYVFDVEEITITDADYRRFLGVSSVLVRDTFNSFILKMEDLFQFCYVCYVQEHMQQIRKEKTAET